MSFLEDLVCVSSMDPKQPLGSIDATKIRFFGSESDFPMPGDRPVAVAGRRPPAPGVARSTAFTASRDENPSCANCNVVEICVVLWCLWFGACF